MPFGRVGFSKDGNLPAPLRAGDGLVANLGPFAYAAETDETILTSQLSGGLIHQGTTLTSDVTYTLPTAALLVAEWPEMDIGDSWSFIVTNSQVGAFDVIIAVGTGITAIGANNTLATPPQSSRIYTLVKTAAATFDLY